MKKLSLKHGQSDQKKKARPEMPKWLKAIGKVLGIIFRPLRPLGRYVRGAWQELRQVKWPSRKTALKLTGAVIVFTAVMTGFTVALDWVFEQIVKRILL